MLLNSILSDDFIHIADTNIVQLFLGFGSRETDEQASEERNSRCQKNNSCGEYCGHFSFSDGPSVWDAIERLWRQKRLAFG